uniref:hypothetical protein n=1 Tax=Mobilicoccus sp. TaxID=2034349 RepID=UPI0028B1DA9C
MSEAAAMTLPHLWRLDDDVVPVHTHDDREILVRRGPDGATEVYGGDREASDDACGRLGSDTALGMAAQALGEDSAGGRVSRRAVLGGLAALG